MLLAGIGKLPDTVADRSIIIAMARKRPDEKVRRLRSRDGGELHDLLRKATRWATDNLGAIKLADPNSPEQLHDRAADAWSPLFAIADVAGGQWPDRARKASIELIDGGAAAESAREMLLADLREMFAAEPSGVLFSHEILPALHKREDRPWSEWGKIGKPITGRQVASLLKPLEVKTNQTVRRGAERDKGYHVAWFEDLFVRYLPISVGDIGDKIEKQEIFDIAIGDNKLGLSPKGIAPKPQKTSFVTDITDPESRDDNLPFDDPDDIPLTPPGGPGRIRI
jgi:hypothetical protein